ncbi:MAG TPA: hypothetical protein H9987_11350 [Candidatus Luteococcus avicola]|nr:hypothetical protein [Candidatus Luteococcus avicola]
MKFLKWLFVLLGVAALVAAAVLLVRVAWDMNSLLSAVRDYNKHVDPRRNIYITSALAALGGLLLGWGIGLPARTGRRIRHQYREDLEARGVQVESRD